MELQQWNEQKRSLVWGLFRDRSRLGLGLGGFGLGLVLGFGNECNELKELNP